MDNEFSQRIFRGEVTWEDFLANAQSGHEVIYRGNEPLGVKNWAHADDGSWIGFEFNDECNADPVRFSIEYNETSLFEYVDSDSPNLVTTTYIAIADGTGLSFRFLCYGQGHGVKTETVVNMTLEGLRLSDLLDQTHDMFCDMRPECFERPDQRWNVVIKVTGSAGTTDQINWFSPVNTQVVANLKDCTRRFDYLEICSKLYYVQDYISPYLTLVTDEGGPDITVIDAMLHPNGIWIIKDAVGRYYEAEGIDLTDSEEEEE